MATSLFLGAKFFPRKDLFVIHQDVFKGIDWVGGRVEITGIILLVFAMSAINAVLAEFIYDRERFLSYLFSYSTLVLNILFVAAAITINLFN